MTVRESRSGECTCSSQHSNDRIEEILRETQRARYAQHLAPCTFFDTKPPTNHRHQLLHRQILTGKQITLPNNSVLGNSNQPALSLLPKSVSRSKLEVLGDEPIRRRSVSRWFVSLVEHKGPLSEVFHYSRVNRGSGSSLPALMGVTGSYFDASVPVL